LHRDIEQVGGVVKDYDHAGRPNRVFQDVGGCFLYDPVNRELSAWRQRARLTIDGQRCRQASCADLRQQPVDLSKAGLGGQLFGGTVVPQHTQQPPGVAKGLAADPG
jgi:hypothetical protein